MTCSLTKSIRERRAIRAFHPDASVPQQELKEILELAQNAPSGSNAQPWRVYVVRGQTRDKLVKAVTAEHDRRFDTQEGATYGPGLSYYPERWVEPYLGRRRQNGGALYEALEIKRGDRRAMHIQHRRNFEFFDAPVGMLFTIDKRLGYGSLVDYGIYLQTLMLAAQSRGWDTCPQAAWNVFDDVIRPIIGSTPDEVVLCGMSIGRADTTAIENRISTPRQSVEDVATFLDH